MQYQVEARRDGASRRRCSRRAGSRMLGTWGLLRQSKPVPRLGRRGVPPRRCRDLRISISGPPRESRLESAVTIVDVLVHGTHGLGFENDHPGGTVRVGTTTYGTQVR